MSLNSSSHPPFFYFAFPAPPPAPRIAPAQLRSASYHHCRSSFSCKAFSAILPSSLSLYIYLVTMSAQGYYQQGGPQYPQHPQQASSAPSLRFPSISPACLDTYGWVSSNAVDCEIVIHVAYVLECAMQPHGNCILPPKLCVLL